MSTQAKTAKPAAPKTATKVPFGVANGAADQPHTKRAVQQARQSDKDQAAMEAAVRMAMPDRKGSEVKYLAAWELAKPAFMQERADKAKAGEIFYSVGTRFSWGTVVPANGKQIYPAVVAATAPKAKVAAAPKVPRAPKADKAPATVQKITILDKAFTFGADGTKRAESWAACKAAKDTAEYAAKGGATKYLARWVSAKAIRLG